MVGNQQLLIGGGIILILLFAMMNTKDKKPQPTQLIILPPDQPDRPDRPVLGGGEDESESMADSSVPYPPKEKGGKGDDYDHRMNESLRHIQAGHNKLNDQTRELFVKLNAWSRQTMVLGTALTDNVRQLCTDITNLNQKIRVFLREFNLRRDSTNYTVLHNILSQNMWYWHQLQLMLQSSEHHKDVGRIALMIREPTDS